MSLRFLANDRIVETEAWAMSPALDHIRKDLGLTGTKEGCREGDCGACAVLVGDRAASSFTYRALPSCLLALGELEGRHLLTIEGLASGGQTPVMKALAEANGSQCGFCSPGFVVSLTAYLMNGDGPGRGLSVEGAYSSVEGNLCRCTGYGAIKRAAEALVARFSSLPAEPTARLEALIAAGALPPSCASFARGELLEKAKAEEAGAPSGGAALLPLGGGTDFFVRNPEPEAAAYPAFALLDRDGALKKVERIGAGEGAVLELGAALSWREFFSAPELLRLVPGIEAYEKLLASPLVRERATIGGNIANASPVGDVTAILLALGASLRVEGPDGSRRLSLEGFFLGYKKIDLAPRELIEAVLLPAARPFGFFSFEKLSKRERLDIAVVNSAAAFEAEAEGSRYRITRARISAGGVAPVPMLLAKAASFLEGRLLDAKAALEAAAIAAAEIAPIGDVRGSADYRRRALERLVLAHLIKLFPGSGIEEAVS